MSEAPALPFSPQEYGRRLSALRSRMAERGVDLLIVDAQEHLAYLTGYAPSGTLYQPCLVPLEGEPVMVVRWLDEPLLLETSWVRERVSYADWEDPVAVLCRTVRERGWAGRRIGLETDSHYLTVRTQEAIRAGLPGATFVDFSGVLWDLRLRKSPEELALLRRVARIAEEAFLRGLDTAGEGVPEREVAAVMDTAALALGADHYPSALVASGPRTGVLHARLGDRRLQRGDILHIEMIPQLHGYSARTMRDTHIGPPPPEVERWARDLIAVQDEQLAAMRPGVPAREVDRVAREGLARAGLRTDLKGITGYTLGYVAPPRVSDFSRIFTPAADWTLEEGMVFHMYLWARGLSISETVAVTRDGVERLTTLERRLFVR